MTGITQEVADQKHLKELDDYKDQAPRTVPVMEIFGPTIQGEGAMIGIKTMFVRFGGCDYRCQKCDSLHAIIPELVKKNANWVLPSDIAEMLITKMDETGTQWVTLSGGNPVMWDLIELVALLQSAGKKVAVETQGTLWRDWIRRCDQVTISPKGPGMGERFNPTQFKQFMLHLLASPYLSPKCCVKIVVFGQDDFEFAVGVEDILKELMINSKDNLYLSLGNDHPPSLNDDGTIRTEPAILDAGSFVFPSLHTYLLWKYKMLLEDYFQDPRLSEWKFLPQLHVLVWDNKAGV